MSERADIEADIEVHPFEPFVPDNARVLIMGTFPPGEHRRSMDFYYPNRSNDFWRIMGLIFLGDSNALYDTASRHYRLEEIKALMTEKGIALSDTGHRVRRLKGNASDKYLDILEPVDLPGLLGRMPHCRAIATTGEKAAQVISVLTSAPAPPMGQYVSAPSGLEIWRLPSTSRAYPLRLDKKAEYYRTMFDHTGIH